MVQVAGRKVMWDTRKSNQGKGDMWAPCPFHQEKTASFHVDDRKGYYYCFGCHAKGDAIGFVKETENVSFMEAIEILAREVGMPMPARDPKAQQKADKRTQLAEVTEAACQFFKLQFKTQAASDARAYLERRRMRSETIDRFEIGFAPNAWQGLWDHLVGKGIAEELILDAGLAKPSNSGKRPYDTFRNRIIFPIRDPRGRCIGFGGRAMDPNDNAKYLNSPETALFDKGRSLYHHGPAREAVGKGQPLIVAEGYMDVIALSEAGFGGAVAPLGTAVTETQLQLMWRIADEPIIALDGDAAGIRAAQRVMDLALPLLEAGKSLRFVMMPEGQDPDDVVKNGGAQAFQDKLDNAQSMVNLLWARETEGRNFDSPERKAALDKVLRERIKAIKDPSIRQHYGQEIKQLRWALFNPRQQSRTPWQPFNARSKQNAASATAKSSALAAEGTNALVIRQAIVLASLIKTPDAILDMEDELFKMRCDNPEYERLRQLLVGNSLTPNRLPEVVEAELGRPALEALFNLPHVRIAPPVKNAGDREYVLNCIRPMFAAITADVAHQQELLEALEDMERGADEETTWRLAQSAKTVEEASRGQNEDKAVYETAQNGVKIKLNERQALDALVEGINFSGSSRRKR